MAPGGRASTRQRTRNHRPGGVVQLPRQEVRLLYRPIEILAADQVEAIHQASLEILRDIGVNFLLPEAREILRQGGAMLEDGGSRVRFDPALVEALVAKAPDRFVLHARNPGHDCVIGGDHLCFLTVGGAPNISDLARGRRPGNFADYCDVLRVAQSLNVIHAVAGYPLEPIDLDPKERHLVAGEALATLTGKPLFGIPLGRRRILDMIEMARLVHGLSEAELLLRPVIFTNINANSPLQYDRPMLWAMIEMARANQPTIVTPFTLAGAMAPVTIIGALAQQNAEALAGIALIQLVRPGAPVVYGGFTSNVDMHSGAPAFGTPEATQAAIIGGQLVRRYRLPYRLSNVNTANAPDAQAAYESAMSLWGAIMGGGNMIIHAAGWMEGGLCASFEKMVIDAEMLQLMVRFLVPPAVDRDTLALDAMHEVGPAGHYFGARHTLARYETAFYTPMLSDWRSYQSWRDAGSPDTAVRAAGLVKRLLADYQPPPLDEARRDALAAFVARRRAEGGAPPED
jgi:trimethylamine--corrinoid protein Co-methyltransferase